MTENLFFLGFCCQIFISQRTFLIILQVKFSVIHPGTKIWPHCGPTNCRIRAHLGLKVPQGIKIRVAGDTRWVPQGIKIRVAGDTRWVPKGIKIRVAGDTR